MDTFPYLFAAYAVIWVALLVYLLVINNRQTQLQREIDSVRKALKETEKEG